MKIDCLILGEYETNCYVLRSSETTEDCLVVDPGLGAGQLAQFLKEHTLNPVAVVLTHGHIDHIAGVAVLREEFPDIKVTIYLTPEPQYGGAIGAAQLANKAAQMERPNLEAPISGVEAGGSRRRAGKAVVSWWRGLPGGEGVCPH